MKVGGRYPVRLVRAMWLTSNKPRWLPVAGRLHHDAKDINFPWLHWHLDWRFMRKNLVKGRGSSVVTNPVMLRRVLPEDVTHLDHDVYWNGARQRLTHTEAREGDIKALRALRQVPRETWMRTGHWKMKRRWDELWTDDHVARHAGLEVKGPIGVRLQGLGNKISGDDLRIDPDRPVCPHRQFDLTHAPRMDGTIICPLHGMTFCAKTGRRMI